MQELEEELKAAETLISHYLPRKRLFCFIRGANHICVVFLLSAVSFLFHGTIFKYQLKAVK